MRSKAKKGKMGGRTIGALTRENSNPVFEAYVLLSSKKWDREKLASDIRRRWHLGLRVSDEDMLLFNSGSMLGSLILFPKPFDGDLVAESAELNWRWPDAAEITGRHEACIAVTIHGGGSMHDRGIMLVRLVLSCCRLKNVLAVVANNIPQEPDDYVRKAKWMSKDLYPVANWVWVGIGLTDGGISAYTQGMEVFRRRELEVIDVSAKPEELYAFMMRAAIAILGFDEFPEDGDRIEMDDGKVHTVSLSEGVLIPGTTMKVEWNGFSVKEMMS